MNPEVAILSHIITTRDVSTPLNADVEKSFIVHDDEWHFIKDYYKDYREAPSLDVFSAKFPDFDVIQTDGVFQHYIDELHNYKANHVIRELLVESSQTLREYGPKSVIQRMTKELAQLSRDTKMIRDLDLVSSSNERLDTLRERIELRATGRKTLGIPTGIQRLDERFGGLMRGDFVVIAGWTGSLKSWLALYMALNAWKEGYRVLYFSLEMSGEQLGYRMDTLLGAGMFSHTALTFGTEDVTYDKYKTWLGEIMRDKHPFVVVSNEDLDEINQDVVHAKIDQWKPDLCVLDYHGLFDDASGATGETEKTKNLSKAFKRIAIKTGVPIVDITAVTQDKKDLGNSPPELGDLAWSKQLAYDSDLTIALCKHGDTLEVVSRKTRRGQEFRTFFNWDVDSGIVKELLINNKVDFIKDGETDEDDEDF